MSAKRALIVDDSKSARLFLARVLQDFEIDVDSAESAEAAIDYLSSNRPDVIFMDHQMPGMDGLQAVQAIKNDPRTATIPIMMYTSQEGELYLGQARALGALGVLPKQIKPTDVSKVLYQLHLVPDRRIPEQSSFTPLNAPIADSLERVTAPASRSPRAPCASTSPTCAARSSPCVDTQTDRITAEARALLRDALPVPPRARTAGQPVALAVGDRRHGAGGCAGQHVAVVAQRSSSREPQCPGGTACAPAGRDCRAGAATATAAAAAAAPGATTTAAVETKPIGVLVPYGAEPLGGARLEVIGRLLERLVRQNATGVVEIRSLRGALLPDGQWHRWLLARTRGTALFALRRAGQPFRGGPHACAAHTAGSGQPDRRRAQFHARGTGCSGLGGRSCAPRAAVSARGRELTAGEWNRAASANNRIEIRLR